MLFIIILLEFIEDGSLIHRADKLINSLPMIHTHDITQTEAQVQGGGGGVIKNFSHSKKYYQDSFGCGVDIFGSQEILFGGGARRKFLFKGFVLFFGAFLSHTRRQ